MIKTDTKNGKTLVDALKHLRSAIELLDSSRAPGHIAAHVDLAAGQLEEFLEPTERNVWGTN